MRFSQLCTETAGRDVLQRTTFYFYTLSTFQSLNLFIFTAVEKFNQYFCVFFFLHDLLEQRMCGLLLPVDDSPQRSFLRVYFRVALIFMLLCKKKIQQLHSASSILQQYLFCVSTSPKDFEAETKSGIQCSLESLPIPFGV